MTNNNGLYINSTRSHKKITIISTLIYYISQDTVHSHIQGHFTSANPLTDMLKDLRGKPCRYRENMHRESRELDIVTNLSPGL